jgi:hypothetical protein
MMHWLMAMPKLLQLLPFIRVFDQGQVAMDCSILHAQLLLTSLPSVVSTLADIKMCSPAVVCGVHGLVNSPEASWAAMPRKTGC